jgi:DNA-binding transcriptional LysR family regulator
VALDSRIQLHKLELYCRIVEHESVSRAAEDLYVSQPVVSAHLRSLQDRLGTKLLYRDGNRMRTTEAGALVYGWAKDILGRSYEMARRIEGLADGSSGVAVIGTSMTVGSYMLPAVLTQFRAERPQAQITVNVYDPEHAVTSVESGVCDAAALIVDEETLRPGLVWEAVGQEELVLAVAPRSQLSTSIESQMISTLAFVTPPHDLARERIVSRYLMANGVSRGPVVMEFGHPEAIKRAVREGMGVAFLFRSSVQEELARGELREIHISDMPPFIAKVFLVYRQTKDFSPMQLALVNALRTALSERKGPGSAPHTEQPTRA